MSIYNQSLESDKYYHIFNHAVGKDVLFKTDENYSYFFKKYAFYISPIADTFAYCLMPNHFHFALRIKSQKELQQLLTLPKFQTLAKLNTSISKQFSNLFSSYSQAFNKQQNRRGTLFEKPFKRKQITSDIYFKQLIHYIHYNPVHHQFVDDLRNWKYSSYEIYFSDKATLLKREEVINWFVNKENFYLFHKKEIDDKLYVEFE